MSNPSPPKSRWTRMGSAMRRATAFTLPRASTPSIEGERDSDTASTKGSVRSLSINQPSVLLPPKSVASYPSPIPESPMNQDDSKLVTSAPVAQATMASESQSAASPVQEDAYTAPPVLNTGAVGPGGFTDNLDDIPPSQPIRDPSQLQSDSDGHDALAPAPAPAAEPTTTTGPGGFSDSDEIPQKPQSIKASSIQHTDSDSHRPPVVDSTAPRGFIDDDFSENNIAQAPSLKHAESTDNHQPSTIDSSAAGLGGFNDSFDDLHRPTVSREPSFQEPDAKVEPVTQITQPPVLAKPPAEPSTPVREYSAETSSYFDRPVATEPEPNPEATEQFKTQLNNVFPFLPMVETPEEANLSVAPKDEPFQPLQEMPVLGHAASDAPEMPTPEPVAHPSIIPEYTLTSFESGQEVWGGVAHHQVEDTVKRDVDIAASTRSRASSIRSMNTNDPFADPMVPRITVYHHDPDISSAMPQPQISDNYPQAPANRGGDPGVVSMPLPPMHEVIPSRSVSNQTPSNIVTDYHDERLPLLPQATSSKVASYLQPSAASRNIVNVSPQSDVPHASLWPTQVVHQGPRLCDFGWIEYQLPDRTVYYVHPTRRVTADIDLRDERRLDAINIYFERHGDGVSAPVGMELWLLEDGVNNGRRPFRPPRRFLVNHNLRMVTYDQTLVNGESGGRSRKAMEDDQIDIEYRYWYFMEAHPAHTTLPPNARAEAMDVLTWAWTDRLLPAHHAVPAPFAQEECQELTSLLRSFEQSEGGSQATLHTRVVSRILLRVAIWRQQRFRPNKSLPTDIGRRYAFPRQRRPFRRAFIDLIISCLCLGIPYLFFERGRQSRIDEESGSRSAGPMFLICAAASLIAGIVLSASMTFLCLPGLDNFARIAGFVTVLFATFSMMSTLVVLFRWKAETNNPISHIAGEGLMKLSRRSVIMALPVVFLAYAIIAFVTGIVLYSFRSTTSETLSPQHPFEDYIKWTVIGALGGLGGILFTSLVLFGR